MWTVLVAMAISPSPIEDLRIRLDQVCAGFHGRIGYCVRELRTGRTISNRGDERFPTASTIKLTEAIQAVRMVDSGELTWSSEHEVPARADRIEYDASEWSYFMRDGLKIDLDAWVNLMIVYSDNMAARVLREWLGTVRIDQTLSDFGFKDTRLLSSAPPEAVDLRRMNGQFGMGVTTPNEMNRLLEGLYHHLWASDAGCDRVLKIMTHSYWDDLTGATVPTGVSVAIKNGAISRSRSEAAIVFASNPYILTIYTDNQKDQQWSPRNEGEQAIRKMCRLIWAALEPKQPFVPYQGYEKFLPTGGGAE